MGLSGVWKIVAACLLTFTFAAGHSSFEETHAVTGTLVSQADDSPIAGATVTAVDAFGEPITSDKTSSGHGTYLLSVPVSRQQYALLFHHEDFMDDVTAYINNTADHKFGDKKLVPANVSRNMSPAEVEKLAGNVEAYEQYGREKNLPIYRAVARRNLERILQTYNPTDAEGMRVQAHIKTQLNTMGRDDLQLDPAIIKRPPTTKAEVMTPAIKPEIKLPEVRSTVKPPEL